MDEKRVYVIAKWRIKDGQLNIVLDLLRKVAMKSTEEEGNLFYKVNQSNADPNTLILLEGYRNLEAQQIHQASEHFQQLVVGKIVPLLQEREVIMTTPLLP